MVFILSGWDAHVAAEFERRKLGKLQPPQAVPAKEDLVARIESTCLQIDNDRIATLFENLDAQSRSAAYSAVKHCLEHHLYTYTVEQNCRKGHAPSRDQLAEAGLQALASLPSEAPAAVVSHYRSLLCGDARSLRRWLASWRKRWGGRLGRLQVSQQLPTDVVQMKAGNFNIS